MKKYKICLFIIISIIVIIIILDILTSDNRSIASRIEIAIPLSCKIDYKDTHGGFHGDGKTFAQVYFNNKNGEEFLTKIKQNSHWRGLPMNEHLQDIVSDTIDTNMNMPIIEQGYWFVLDRHSKAINKYDETRIFDESRYSSNYSVAVFDTDSNILYFYELDT